MNASDILDDILTNLKAELSGGFSTIKDFATTEGRMLAKRAESIAKSRVSGDLKDDDEFFQWLLDALERDTVNMVRSIAVLTVLTLEKAWNAVAKALWGGISKILTAAGVPGILTPSAPPHF